MLFYRRIFAFNESFKILANLVLVANAMFMISAFFVSSQPLPLYEQSNDLV